VGELAARWGMGQSGEREEGEGKRRKGRRKEGRGGAPICPPDMKS